MVTHLPQGCFGTFGKSRLPFQSTQTNALLPTSTSIQSKGITSATPRCAMLTRNTLASFGQIARYDAVAPHTSGWGRHDSTAAVVSTVVHPLDGWYYVRVPRDIRVRAVSVVATWTMLIGCIC